MTGRLSKNFHGVGIAPLSKILAVKSFLLYNFQEKVHQDLRLNDQRQKEDPDARARKFFSQLPRSIIIQLYHAYKIDFDMFGYEEPKKYIEMGYILPDESNEIGPPNNDPRRPNIL